MRSSCTDVITARNSLSKICSELRHPAETTRISFPLSCSSNLPENESHSPGWLWATAGCPSLYKAVPAWGQVDPQPVFKPVGSWAKASLTSIPAPQPMLELFSSPGISVSSALLALWLGAFLTDCSAGDTPFWVAEPVSMRKCLCRALPWASHDQNLVPAGRCQCRKGICIFNSSSCSFTAPEQLPEQIRLPHTYSRLPPRSC